MIKDGVDSNSINAVTHHDVDNSHTTSAPIQSNTSLQSSTPLQSNAPCEKPLYRVDSDSKFIVNGKTWRNLCACNDLKEVTVDAIERILCPPSEKFIDKDNNIPPFFTLNSSIEQVNVVSHAADSTSTDTADISDDNLIKQSIELFKQSDFSSN